MDNQGPNNYNYNNGPGNNGSGGNGNNGGNEYIIEYSQSVRMGVPGGSQQSVCGFY